MTEGKLQKKLREEVKGITESSLLRQDVAIDLVLRIVEEAKKDLILPMSRSHRTHWHKDKEINTTTYLDKDIEEFKVKLKNWFGEREEDSRG